MKIISWNVNGIKSKYKSGNLEDLIKNEKPDILCIQEIKTKDVPEIDGYSLYSYPASKNSRFYGTALYTKIEPLSVDKGFGDDEFDQEGRVIRLEFENFNLFNVYSPSGAGSDDKLKRKYRFFDEFTKYFKNSKKPVVVCGDFNRMAAEIDSKRPELMKNKSGFMPEEQEWFKEILKELFDEYEDDIDSDVKEKVDRYDEDVQELIHEVYNHVKDETSLKNEVESYGYDMEDLKEILKDYGYEIGDVFENKISYSDLEDIFYELDGY